MPMNNIKSENVVQTNQLTKIIDGRELVKEKGRNLRISWPKRCREDDGDEDAHQSLEADVRLGGAVWGDTDTDFV